VIEHEHGKVDGSLNDLARASTAWIGVGGAILSILSFCILLGMQFGPLKDMPEKFSIIVTQLSDIKSRMDKTDWAIESLKSRADAMASQQVITSEDRSKTWDALRKIESTATQLKANSMSREDMIEWIAALGSRNKGLSLPSVGRQHDQN
jgi:hypothetical protein